MNAPTRVGPPPRRGSPSPGDAAAATSPAGNGAPRFTVRGGLVAGPQRVVVYGVGGIGKSSLAALAPGALILDVEGSTKRLNVQRISADELQSWDDLRAALLDPALDAAKTIVIDSITKAEEMAAAWTIQNVKTDKGNSVTSIEGYGFGKGYQHVYDTFLNLLSDLDRHIRGGRNVVLIAHECTAKAPNPMGDDFLRYEPRLQQTKEGKASIRNRVFEWADHVLFLGYDVASEDGKGIGAGTRSIFTKEQPTHKAKVREVPGQRLEGRYDYVNETDGGIWPLILGGIAS